MTLINSILAALIVLGIHFSIFWSIFTWGSQEKDVSIFSIGAYVGITLGSVPGGINTIATIPLFFAGLILVVVIKSHRAGMHPLLWRPWSGKKGL